MAMVKEGASELEIADALPGVWARGFKALERYRGLLTPPRNFQTHALVLWGPSGSGKSRRARETEGTQFWISQPRTSTSGCWWGGYCGQDHVVLDEFYGWLPRGFVQRLVDRYPFSVEPKGVEIPFTSKTLIFTSNVCPNDFWKRLGLGAMQRRFSPPIGFVVYVGDAKYPTADSYLNSPDYGPGIPGGDSAVSANLVAPY